MSNTPLTQQEERTWAMAAHVVQYLNFLTGFGGLIALIVLWLAMKDRSRAVEEHGREALNFQITVLIAAAVGSVLTLILVGFLVLAVVVLAHLVLPLLAALAASEGRPYKYPFTLRLIPAPLPPLPPAA